VSRYDEVQEVSLEDRTMIRNVKCAIQMVRSEVGKKEDTRQKNVCHTHTHTYTHTQRHTRTHDGETVSCSVKAMGG
jgi:hypothetical protein